MQVRLGFAIATHLDAPILLIDEVLAVGDLEFQNKCIKKIKELHQQRRTIVLITHNPEAVRNHCDRCVLIDKHHIIFDGPAAQGAGLYEQNMDLNT
jgi:ABC-type polysaccharide/polyol phosphate transport system ATPase subunit